MNIYVRVVPLTSIHQIIIGFYVSMFLCCCPSTSREETFAPVVTWENTDECNPANLPPLPLQAGLTGCGNKTATFILFSAGGDDWGECSQEPGYKATRHKKETPLWSKIESVNQQLPAETLSFISCLDPTSLSLSIYKYCIYKNTCTYKSIVHINIRQKKSLFIYTIIYI